MTPGVRVGKIRENKFLAEIWFLNRVIIFRELNPYNCRMIPLFDQWYQFINTRVT